VQYTFLSFKFLILSFIASAHPLYITPDFWHSPKIFPSSFEEGSSQLVEKQKLTKDFYMPHSPLRRRGDRFFSALAALKNQG
jgi:hypothetical protein